MLRDRRLLIIQAEQGNGESQYLLGQLYYSGENVEKNYRVAFEWFSKAAESGHAAAQRMVAEMLLEGSHEIKKNRKLAFYWMQCAAMQNDIIALERLGDMYAKGECVKDQNMAFEWYMKAAEFGNSLAMVKTGYCYKMGKGIKQNTDKAIYWFRKAAELGEIDACYFLGQLYEGYNGATPCYPLSLSYYLQAAKAGHLWAMFNVALLYDGDYEGIEQNYSEAFYWFSKCSEKEEMGSLYYIAKYYEQGLHVEKNTDKAIELFVTVFCNKSPCYDLDALRELIRLNIVKDVFEMNENGGRLNWYIIGSDQAYTSYNDLRKGLESWLKK